MTQPAVAAACFGAALLMGGALGVLYGFLRPLRPRLTHLADALFVVACFWTWIYLAFAVCGGDIRFAYTAGLAGTPNELKMKYFADNDLKNLSGEELAKAMKEKIRAKDGDLKGNMASQGTTPRRFTDLLGSLCDLTSGSGDRGTPVVLVQGYFTNFATEE